MSIDLISSDVVSFISHKLCDRDLLNFSQTSKKFRGIIKKRFNEYVVIYKIMYSELSNVCAIIERDHPDFLKAIEHNNYLQTRKQQQKFNYYRFLQWSNISTINIGRVTFSMKVSEFSSTLAPVFHTNRSNIENVNRILEQKISKLEKRFKKENYSIFPEKHNKKHVRLKDNLDKVEKDSCSTISFYHLYNDEGYYFDAATFQYHKKLTKGILVKMYDGLWNSIINKKIEKKEKLQFNRYLLTHDNGGIPFAVLRTCDDNYIAGYDIEGSLYNKEKSTHSRDVLILKRSGEFECNDGEYESLDNYDILVCEYRNVIQIFEGISTPWSDDEDDDEDSESESYVENDVNSVLLHIKQNRYVHIGINVYEFETPENDNIIKYFSHMGSNDVPYPIALGEKYVYFMLNYVCVPRSEFPKRFQESIDEYEDAYTYFYGYIDEYLKIQKKYDFVNFKCIHPRFY